jgi:hypothetical protein
VTGAVTVTEAQINLLTDSTKTVGETLARFSLSIVDNDSILTASDDTLARLSLTVSAASTRVALLETLGFQGQSLTIVTTAHTFSVSYTNSSARSMWVGLSLTLGIFDVVRAYINGSEAAQVRGVPDETGNTRGRTLQLMLAPGDLIYLTKNGTPTIGVWAERT